MTEPRPSLSPTAAAAPAPAGEADRATLRRERGLLFTLAGMQFTHIVDFMVMMPLGPQFTRLFGIGDAQFGLLVSAYTLAAGASGLAASLFVDRFERKRLLLVLYLCFAVATLGCGLADSYGWLMAARVAAGVFGGMLGALVQTVVGDAIPYERRGRATGVVMASFSLATVAGVPASLWLATHFGWQSCFIAIAAASGLLAMAGARTLPRLDAHLRAARAAGPWQTIAAVLREPNHWRAFGLTALLMASGFSIIPFLTLYMTSNMGLAAEQVPLVYLVGGVATFGSSRLIGWAADRWGKARCFRAVSLLSVLPMLAMTHLGPVPLALLLAASTAFFVLVSGRMVPAMAIVTSAVATPLRGSFMSLNGAVQSAAMGLASLAGGLLIGRDAAGLLTGYEHNGWLAAAVSLLAAAWVGRVRRAP